MPFDRRPSRGRDSEKRSCVILGKEYLTDSYRSRYTCKIPFSNDIRKHFSSNRLAVVCAIYQSNIANELLNATLCCCNVESCTAEFTVCQNSNVICTEVVVGILTIPVECAVCEACRLKSAEAYPASECSVFSSQLSISSFNSCEVHCICTVEVGICNSDVTSQTVLIQCAEVGFSIRTVHYYEVVNHFALSSRSITSRSNCTRIRSSSCRNCISPSSECSCCICIRCIKCGRRSLCIYRDRYTLGQIIIDYIIAHCVYTIIIINCCIEIYTSDYSGRFFSRLQSILCVECTYFVLFTINCSLKYVYIVIPAPVILPCITNSISILTIKINTVTKVHMQRIIGCIFIAILSEVAQCERLCNEHTNICISTTGILDCHDLITVILSCGHTILIHIRAGCICLSRTNDRIQLLTRLELFQTIITTLILVNHDIHCVANSHNVHLGLIVLQESDCTANCHCCYHCVTCNC